MGWVLNASPEVEATSQWPAIVAICIVLSLLSSAIMGFRLYIRHNSRGLASDDWMSLLSIIFALIYSAIAIAQTKYGLGLPLKLRPKDNLIVYTRINYAGRPFYQLGISFFKIALLISYLRLLKGTNYVIYRRVVWSTIAVVFLAHLACTFSLVFACKPVDKSWNPLKAGTCLPAGSSFTAYAVVTIVSDVVVALLPVPVLFKLGIPAAKKVGLVAIFLLGLFTTVCSILRYLEIHRIQFGDGNSTMLVLWGTVEFHVGNIISSLPFLAPVCMRKARNYRSKYSGESSLARSGLKSAERYKLGDVNHDKSVFASADNIRSGNSSAERILAGGITKSMTYNVHIDDKVDGKPSATL